MVGAGLRACDVFDDGNGLAKFARGLRRFPLRSIACPTKAWLMASRL